MTNVLKAIETLYDGCRFRSRLEARWAVFFNEANVPYEYEAEGYDMGGVRYLPDFWLPEQRVFLEVKGQYPNEQDEEKARLLNEYSDCPVFIFNGGFTPGPSGICYCYQIGNDREGQARIEDVEWSRCPSCRWINIVSPSMRYRSLEMRTQWTSRTHCPCEQDMFGVAQDGRNEAEAYAFGCDDPKLIAAYRVASKSRFEFGE